MKKQKKIIISAAVIEGVFCIISYLLAHIPGERADAHFATYQDYINIFDVLPRIYFSSLIGMIIGYYLNTHLILKWKALLKSKHFLLRSIGSSTIGEAFYTSIAVILICIGRYPASLILHFIYITYLITLVSTMVYSIPAAIFNSVLKIVENINVNDRQNSFNPFKSINNTALKK